MRWHIFTLLIFMVAGIVTTVAQVVVFGRVLSIGEMATVAVPVIIACVLSDALEEARGP